MAANLETASMSTPLAALAPTVRSVELLRAVPQHLPAIVRHLAADPLGSSREAAAGQDLEPYERAFQAIDADPAQLLLVATAGEEVVGGLQLSFIPGLARRGSLRAQIEAVRVHQNYRNEGLGAAMFEWAITEARRRGFRRLPRRPETAALTLILQRGGADVVS